mmetsp:Transcript_11442/g.15758  ORF Transcript_11442/g.15758 Transcript_11442/m.15758 type:complete len:137 (+) Transcript_11442:297-707(+)
MANSVIICPTIGYSPEKKAAGLCKVHAEAKRLKNDTTPCRYSWSIYTVALAIARAAAKNNQQNLIKFNWLDISAIKIDFVEHWKNPENETEEIHLVPSYIYINTRYMVFTDDVIYFNWDENKENLDSFPVLMDDET